jgi:hypothetical protein
MNVSRRNVAVGRGAWRIVCCHQHIQAVINLGLQSRDLLRQLVQFALQVLERLNRVLISPLTNLLGGQLGLLVDFRGARFCRLGDGVIVHEARVVFFCQRVDSLSFFLCLRDNAIPFLNDFLGLLDFFRNGDSHLIDDVEKFIFVNKSFGSPRKSPTLYKEGFQAVD